MLRKAFNFPMGTWTRGTLRHIHNVNNNYDNYCLHPFGDRAFTTFIFGIMSFHFGPKPVSSHLLCTGLQMKLTNNNPCLISVLLSDIKKEGVF